MDKLFNYPNASENKQVIENPYSQVAFATDSCCNLITVTFTTP